MLYLVSLLRACTVCFEIEICAGLWKEHSMWLGCHLSWLLRLVLVLSLAVLGPLGSCYLTCKMRGLGPENLKFLLALKSRIFIGLWCRWPLAKSLRHLRVCLFNSSENTSEQKKTNHKQASPLRWSGSGRWARCCISPIRAYYKKEFTLNLESRDLDWMPHFAVSLESFIFFLVSLPLPIKWK